MVSENLFGLDIDFPPMRHGQDIQNTLLHQTKNTSNTSEGVQGVLKNTKRRGVSPATRPEHPRNSKQAISSTRALSAGGKPGLLYKKKSSAYSCVQGCKSEAASRTENKNYFKTQNVFLLLH